MNNNFLLKKLELGSDFNIRTTFTSRSRLREVSHNITSDVTLSRSSTNIGLRDTYLQCYIEIMNNRHFVESSSFENYILRGIFEVTT